MIKFLNLACGDHFVNSPEWVNCDFAPQSKIVKQVNLLRKFPFKAESFDLVYCSHYVEHIELSNIQGFVNECARVLKKRGIIRLALPDFENIAREYVKNKDMNKNEFASFNIVEMIDQCVRVKSGGTLSDWYSRAKNDDLLRDYISARTGQEFKSNLKSQTKLIVRLKRVTLKKLMLKIQLHIYFFLISFFPSWFKNNHISRAATGEKHCWVHDFDSVKFFLDKAGFDEITRVSAFLTLEKEFPLYPLDINSMNQARKGAESMYIEARKI
jgi:predicted SAM-dependent methyltransferase